MHMLCAMVGSDELSQTNLFTHRLLASMLFMYTSIQKCSCIHIMTINTSGQLAVVVVVVCFESALATNHILEIDISSFQ